MLYLNAHQIVEALTLSEAMQCVEEALLAYEEGAFVMPERTAVDCADGNMLLLMPCVAMGSIATKLVTVYPRNRTHDRPVIDGLVVLSDQSTGEILALMDGKTITAMRTGAVSGVSIRYLCRADARTVGLVGCGVQGYYQVLFACAARDIARIALYDRDPAAAARLADRLRTALPENAIEVSPSPRALLQYSDIVITATTSRFPVLPDEAALFAGKHLVAIGSFEPEVREMPDAVFHMADRVWVDIDYAREESGELIVPLRRGLLREDQIETLGHLIRTGKAPERGAHGTTLQKSVGMALLDLTAARRTYANAVQRGLGTAL
jgi:ornithine cyclodeaminase